MAATPKNTIPANMQDDVYRTITGISAKWPYFGHVIMNLEKRFVEGKDEDKSKNGGIATAAVGRIPGERLCKLWINTDYCKELYIEGFKIDATNKYLKTPQGKIWCQSMILHEIYHLISGHLYMEFTDKLRANIACDLAVNSYLTKDEERYEKWCYAKAYGFEDNKAAMWYYLNLKDNKKFQEQCASGAFGPGGQLEHLAGSHSLWDDLKDDEMMKEWIKDVLRKAKESNSNSYGNIPGALQEMLDELLKREPPQLPWNKILRIFVANCVDSELYYTMRRSSKRYGTRPGIRKDDVLRLLLCVDTSGSVSDEQLTEFFHEIQHIHKQGADVTIAEVDCDMQHVSKFTGKFQGIIHGRGGTDLELGFKYADEHKFDAMIYFTDYYAPMVSKQYRTPTLVVISGNKDVKPDQYCYPWARHVHLPEKKENV